MHFHIRRRQEHFKCLEELQSKVILILICVNLQLFYGRNCAAKLHLYHKQYVRAVDSVHNSTGEPTYDL